MDFQDQGRRITDCLPVIGNIGPVGRPDLYKSCAGSSHDIRYPERPPDFDQFPPGDNRFPAGRKRGQAEDDCAGIVVDHQGGIRACSLAQEPFDVVVPVTSISGGKVVFEGAIVFRTLDDRPERRFRKAGTSKVRVDDDTRCIHYPFQGRRIV